MPNRALAFTAALAHTPEDSLQGQPALRARVSSSVDQERYGNPWASSNSSQLPMAVTPEGNPGEVRANLFGRSVRTQWSLQQDRGRDVGEVGWG